MDHIQVWATLIKKLIKLNQEWKLQMGFIANSKIIYYFFQFILIFVGLQGKKFFFKNLHFWDIYTYHTFGCTKGSCSKTPYLIVCLKFSFWTAHRNFQFFCMKLGIWCKKWQQDFSKKIMFLSFGAKIA